MDPFGRPLRLSTPYLIGAVQQGDVKKDKAREASVREGEALHKEALFVPAGARHLVGQLALAQHVSVSFTRVLGTWDGWKQRL